MSKHNSKYWLCQEYIGLGSGASSYIDGVRTKNTDSILEYENRIEETLTRDDKMSEFVILGLRMTQQGISIGEFKKRFDADIYDVFGKELKKHSAFIKRQDDVLKLTPEAYYVSNGILADFLL